MQMIDPIRVSYQKQIQNINDFYNQRKLNEDNMLTLGVERASCLYYNLSKIDIQIWRDIIESGETVDIIQRSAQLENFNVSFSGHSLFHYFASRPEVIELIAEIHHKEEDLRELSVQEQSLALQILNPDPNDKTALKLAIDQQSPHSFEVMVEMLKGFPNLCLSRMMLRTLGLLLSSEQINVLNFFEQSWFRPPQMEIE